MVFANFSTWTEVDSTNKLTQTVPRASWTDMKRDEVCLLYKAMTTNPEFTHHLSFQVTSIDVNTGVGTEFLAYIWVICENAGRPAHIESGRGIKVVVIEKGDSKTQYQLYLTHADDIVQDWSTDLEVGTTYYLKIQKVGAVVTCTIYSDGAQTTVVDIISMDLTGEAEENMSFNYRETTCSWGFVGAVPDQSDGWVEMWLDSSGGLTSGGTMTNDGGALDFEVFSLKESKTCDIAIRAVPDRSTGPKVDTGHYQPHHRLLEITIIVAGGDKSILESIKGSGTKIGISLTNNWFYYGWLRQRNIRWEYRKLNGVEKVWTCKLKFDIEFIRWYA